MNWLWKPMDFHDFPDFHGRGGWLLAQLMGQAPSSGAEDYKRARARFGRGRVALVRNQFQSRCGAGKQGHASRGVVRGSHLGLEIDVWISGIVKDILRSV